MQGENRDPRCSCGVHLSQQEWKRSLHSLSPCRDSLGLCPALLHQHTLNHIPAATITAMPGGKNISGEAKTWERVVVLEDLSPEVSQNGTEDQ